MFRKMQQMSEKQPAQLSAVKKALLAVEEMQKELKKVKREQTEPIAVIGLSCRFPGKSNSPEALWELLKNNVDAITEVPKMRWDIDAYYDPDPDAPGKMYTRYGGFIDPVDMFDANFFGIAPREATHMDPQQRLLLEVTWEALENAHCDMNALAGQNVGVFMGISSNEYAQTSLHPEEPEKVNAYLGTGNALSAAAGRLSYTLGFQGPSISVDTACSSSLVSLHMACQSLRNNECEMAVAGGVNVMLSPITTITFSKARMMAADGRCKTFDAAANGYVRGEGCGVIILKRLSKAIADEDPILAVIKGSAINQDGRSGGFTAPNGLAQEQVIKKALKAAKVKPQNVQYIEAHGTGTPLGDPIEVNALCEVLKQERSAPFFIGSIKTNIGHLEAAAGIAGVIKVILALNHEIIPAHLHFKEPNPYIPWDHVPAKVATENTPWKRGDKERIAGVSSFGFTGTNAHIVISEAPVQNIEPSLEADGHQHILCLSAKSNEALQQKIQQHLEICQQEISITDICTYNNMRRAHFPYRVAVNASNLKEIRNYLDKKIDRQYKPVENKKDVVFMFTGQGSQYFGMAKELYRQNEVFREHFDQCSEILNVLLPKPINECLWDGEDTGDVHETLFTQPTLFAVEYSLAQVWLNWGVQPAVVLGHSVGEYVAACIAGVFSVKDALTLIAKRAALMQFLPANGGMMVAFTDSITTAEIIKPFAAKVSLAAHNGPSNTVISGEKETLKEIEVILEQKDIQFQHLIVSHAFHSFLMEPMLDKFKKAASKVTFAQPQITLISNLTGKPVNEEITTPDYWCRHIREAVKFQESISFLEEEGHEIFMEIGPNPVLSGMAQRCLKQKNKHIWIPTLRKDKNDTTEVYNALGKLYESGFKLNWQKIYGNVNLSATSLPNYPFQRERYWIEDPVYQRRKRNHVHYSFGGHPYLQQQIYTANGQIICQAQIGVNEFSYLKDHQIYNSVIFPATGYLEMAMATAKQIFSALQIEIADFAIYEPLVLAQDSTVVQIVITPQSDEAATFEILSRSDNEGISKIWKTHATGKIAICKEEVTTSVNTSDYIGTKINPQEYYQNLADLGLQYGTTFQGIQKLSCHENDVLAYIELQEQDSEQYHIHPALLDSCLQSLAAIFRNSDVPSVYIPIALSKLQLYKTNTPLSSLWCYLKITSSLKKQQEVVTANLELLDKDLSIVAHIENIQFKRAEKGSLKSNESQYLDSLYTIDWQHFVATEQNKTTQNDNWLVFGEPDSFPHLQNAIFVAHNKKNKQVTPHHFHLASCTNKDLDWLIQQLDTHQKYRILFLWPLYTTSTLVDIDNHHKSQDDGCYGLLHIIQKCIAQDISINKLCVVTQKQIQITENDIPQLTHSPIWGMCKSIFLEYSQLHCKCIDIDDNNASTKNILQTILDQDTEENEFAIRNDKIYVARLVRYDKAYRDLLAIPETENYLLGIDKKGTIDNVTLQPQQRKKPQDEEVEVRVYATGLNFRDVMNVLGLYPGEAGAMGSEFAGEVVEVGNKVTDVQKGDFVFGIAGGSFSKYVIAQRSLIAHQPKNMNFNEAATIPVTFLTAYYGIVCYAKAQKGERILIHSAAGGVGLAALQLAEWLQLDVYATASIPKHDTLIANGVNPKQIMDSRSLDFAQKIKDITLNEGVDIVLNSLAGDYIPLSIDLLRKDGRFIEIGKVDIWDQQKVIARNKDCSYCAFDLAEICKENPALVQEMFSTMNALFAKKKLQPLQNKVFFLKETKKALRYMAQAKHIGKVVLSQEDTTYKIDGNSTYLITGGFGGLGIKTAEWLVAKGAQHIVLWTHGKIDAQKKERISHLDNQISIYSYSVDVSSKSLVEKTIKQMAKKHPPLRGIFHAAGSVDDAILAEQTPEKFARIAAVKAQGAWNLHTATLDHALHFFVMFSSIASVMGSPGQTNYSAANFFLDSLAHYRKQQNLPALSINWGPWAEVGMAARTKQIRNNGIASIKPEMGVALLENLLNQPYPQVTAIHIAWPQFIRSFPQGKIPKFLSVVTRGLQTTKKAIGTNNISEKLETMPANERRSFLVALISEQVSTIMGVDVGAINAKQPLQELGLDSLMAVELKNTVEQEIGNELPTTLLFDYPHVEAIVAYLLNDVFVLGEENTVNQIAIAETKFGEEDEIAIVGMSCRFPGANNLQEFWQLLQDGVDAISEVPINRWDIEEFYDPDPDTPGKMYTKYGGFVDNIDLFDAAFFGIAPREAESMDPQQRLFLEVSWEALENAGELNSNLSGSQTGVFVGVSTRDYIELFSQSQNSQNIHAYLGTGNAFSAISGRLSYILGLEGPSLSVDTACSSSLTATHLACTSLKRGESNLAIVGGVNLTLSPMTTINFCKARMMAADGRCKTFDKSANGYVRGEGCGVVVLKRLKDAQKDGNHIYAVIKGSAINQDGQSGGLTAPNGPSQEKVIQKALRAARLAPKDVSYIEAHGTGTSLGDPIEVQALGKVLKIERAENDPFLIGSLKTNIGHLEAAAGVAGLIKTALAIDNGKLPPHLHFNEPSPYIPWQDIPIKVVTELCDWPQNKTKVAGLSSFGFTGTNVHIVLSEASTEKIVPTSVENIPAVLTLTARSEKALRTVATEWATHLQKIPNEYISHALFTAHQGRMAMNHRLVTWGKTNEELCTALNDFACQQNNASNVYDKASGEIDKVAWLFTGQGAQYFAMGKELYEKEQVFQEAMDRCEAIFKKETQESLLEVMFIHQDQELIHNTKYTQPALLAIEYSLAQLWLSWGVKPQAVMGHSVGEFAALCIAGVLSLEDSIKLIAARGRLMGALPQNGTMAVIFSGVDEVEKEIEPYVDKISIAAKNGPENTVISGDKQLIMQLLEKWEQQNVRVQELTVSHAFHSPLMDDVLDDFRAVATTITVHPPQINIVENVNGEFAQQDTFGADYWCNHIRQAVSFQTSIEKLYAQGYRAFVEIGPAPILLGMARNCIPAKTKIHWIPSLRSGQSDIEQMRKNFGKLYASGYNINWNAVYHKESYQKLVLPTYPFEKKRYWLETSTKKASMGTGVAHPFLYQYTQTISGQIILEGQLGTGKHKYLRDHKVFGNVIFPATGYVELALSAAQQILSEETFSLSNINIYEPMLLNSERTIQIMVTPESASTFAFEIHSHEVAQNEWQKHVGGSINIMDNNIVPTTQILTTFLREQKIASKIYYETLHKLGLEYDTYFQGISQLYSHDYEALAYVDLAQKIAYDDYQIHPAVLDSCLQTVAAILHNNNIKQNVYIPIRIGNVTLIKSSPKQLWVHTKVTSQLDKQQQLVVADFTLVDDDGVVAKLESVEFKSISRSLLTRDLSSDWLYQQVWRKQELSQQELAPTNWLVFNNNDNHSQIISGLTSKQHRLYIVDKGKECKAQENTLFIRHNREEDYKWLWEQIAPSSEQKTNCNILYLSLSQEQEVHEIDDLFLCLQSKTPNCSVNKTFVITNNSQSVIPTDKVEGYNDGTLWGFMKTLTLEYPDNDYICVDMDGYGAHTNDNILKALQTDGTEKQIAFRNNESYIARLVRYYGQKDKLNIPLGSDNYRLHIPSKGVIDNLVVEAMERDELQADNVEIKIHAAGLNFRDVMNVLGLYPGDAGALGGECAGEIVRIGSGVSEFAIGDRVCGIASGCFRKYTKAHKLLIAKIPDTMNYNEATTIPITFLTAYYAFQYVAQLKENERILIHAAAGGVGLAAVQLAKWYKAEIFATAGSEEKRDLLASMGISHIMNSRSVDFAEQIQEITQQQGIDVILNSLSGEFIPKSMSLLREKGRFVEIGKVEIWTQQQVAEYKSDVAYTAFDLAEMCAADPEFVQKMLTEVLELFATGKLKPLPHTIFPLIEAKQAFRYMAQAKHIGKVVIQVARDKEWHVRSEAMYIITGGFGGLGLKTAEWLIQQGAQHISLIGRSKPKEVVQQQLSKWSKESIDIHMFFGDISNYDHMAEILTEIEQLGIAIKGIFHTAGVLKDALFVQQTQKNLQEVMDPKVVGTFILHQRTLKYDLDCFVLYASVASTLGSMAQSNYSIANAYLDSLVHHRRALGLPATTINWGPWAEVGMAARSDIRHRKSFGFHDIPLQKGFNILDFVLTSDIAQIMVAHIKWENYIRGEVPKFLSEVVRHVVKKKKESSSDFVATIKSMPASERRFYLLGTIRKEVAKVLGIDDDSSIDSEQPLQEMGLDSLMAVELKNAVEATIGEELPTTLLFDYPNIASMADYLLAEYQLEEETTTTATAMLRAISDNEPIAIVGLSCRFPGAKNKEEFWTLLQENTDAIKEVPSTRWDLDEYYDSDPEAPGKMYTKYGGFIDNVDLFDAEFFGIAPREAASMDPQQRLFLEVSWEALEDAGEMKATLENSKTGVFVGVSTRDYADLFISSNELDKIQAYLGTGNAFSAVSGRLSYVLGLQGPSMSIDTACSSSLVATHLACQSLRKGESNMAVVGGVNLILAPSTTINFCKAKMMAADGRCKTFDKAANGYVRGEGCGVVVLKRLSDAIEDGNHIYSIIKGSAVNQDGQSGGLTAPNGPSQEKVIQEALQDAQVLAKDVNYIEAHGTGTALGDPIELQALGKALSKDREKPFIVGSLKTNIGHLEAAAGVAGLIKTALSLHHNKIPAHLHFKEPSPYIPWKNIPVEVATKNMDWPQSPTKIAGLSSFGFTGTNVHIVLQEAPERAMPKIIGEKALFTLSARNENALKETAQKWLDYLDKTEDVDLGTLLYTVNVARAHFNHRLGILVENKQQLKQDLSRFMSNEKNANIHFSKANKPIEKLAWLFTGQGSQYFGMGQELYQNERIFRENFDKCATLLREHHNIDILQAVYSGSDKELIHNTAYTQPALFSLQYSLAQLWLSWGIAPSAVMGHSIGEFAAACIAGVFSLEDGLKLVATRGRLMSTLPKDGSMAVIFTTANEVAKSIDVTTDKVSLAAINGSENVVISGDKQQVSSICKKWQQQNIRVEMLTVSHAFHSPLMEPILEDYRKVALSCTYKTPQLALVSNITGKFTNSDTIDADYWCTHIRQPVLFATGMAFLEQQQYHNYLEIGPSPVLLGMGKRCVLDDKKGLWLPSLRPNQSNLGQMNKSFATLYTHNYSIAWNKIYSKGGHASFPTYAFQGKRHWLDVTPRSNNSIDVQKQGHPLLGTRLFSPLIKEYVFANTLHVQKQLRFLRDHRVYDNIVLPASAYLEMIIAATQTIFPDGSIIKNVNLQEPLILSEEAHCEVQLIAQQTTEGLDIQICSRDQDAADWKTHISARAESFNDDSNSISDLVVENDLIQVTDMGKSYDALKTLGLDYGKVFQGVQAIHLEDSKIVGHISIPTKNVADYFFHPALMDSCFQVLAAHIAQEDSQNAYIPIGVESIRVFERAQQSAISYIVPLKLQSDMFIADIDIYSTQGKILAQIKGFRVRRVSRTAINSILERQFFDSWFVIKWQKMPLETSSDNIELVDWVIVGNNDHNKALISYLKSHNATIHRIATIDNKEQCRELWNNLSLQHKQIQVIFVGNDNIDIVSQAYHNTTALLHLVQTLKEKKQAAQLNIVTYDTMCIAEEMQLNMGTSTLAAFSKVIGLEHPELHCTYIDVSSNDSENADKIIIEVLASTEEQVVYRDKDRYVARLQEYEKQKRSLSILEIPEGPFHLDMSRKGVLKNLTYVPCERHEPQQGQIEIEVFATGLNFRDLMNALGLYPGDAGHLGGECSGKIVAVGNNVTDYKIGDEVMAIAPASFGKYVTTATHLVMRKPQHISFAEGATVPITFLTVYYGLGHLAKLHKNDKILIHAAAGGVGIAAIQYAQHIGAEVFATAGNEEKRSYLRSLGVQHIFDSRSLNFAQQIEMLVGTKGLDVVLNSLAGEFIPKSIGLLKNNGRFIEIGKVEILSAEQVKELHENIIYYSFDLAEMAEKEPRLMAQMFSNLSDDFATKIYQPLPLKVFSYEKTIDAFRYMSRAKHIGKIVVSGRNQNELVINSEACYLITGGMGAIGQEIMKWLIQKGVTNIVLWGRNLPKENVLHNIENAKKEGVNVHSFALDVTNQDIVNATLCEIEKDIAPLKGIFHAAGLLNDGFITQQTAENFSEVMQPKINGSWYLHEYTKDKELDFFVLFSSIASFMGSPGQANYAAANSFMDQLAYYRIQQNLPATTINWGPWATSGMAATTQNKGKNIWQKRGIETIEAVEGMKHLEMLITKQQTQVAVLTVKKQIFMEQLLQSRQLNLFNLWIEEARKHVDPSTLITPAAFRDELEKITPEKRLDALTNYMRDEIGKVLELPGEDIDPEIGFFDLGMDSLTAMEFKNSLEINLGYTLQTSVVFDYPTIESLAKYLIVDIFGDSEVVEEKVVSQVDITSQKQQPQIDEDELDAMSEDDLMELLAGELDDLGRK